MKKSLRKPKLNPTPVSTADLHRVVGGATVIYTQPVKSTGGLDNSTSGG